MSEEEDDTLETEMRDSDVPKHKTSEELVRYIDSLVEMDHTYGSCVYAMSKAAVATFNYVAGQLGVTGFQASCADMDILKRTRMLKGPFCIMDGENLLYPQYDLRARLNELIAEWTPWAAKEAQERLDAGDSACDSVREHWQRLARKADA